MAPMGWKSHLDYFFVLINEFNQEVYMKFSMKMLVMAIAAMFLTTGLAIAGPEKDPLKPRVPADKRAAAKKDKSPLYKKASKASAEIIAEGKAIFEGKGTCVRCETRQQSPTRALRGHPRRL